MSRISAFIRELKQHASTKPGHYYTPKYIFHYGPSRVEVRLGVEHGRHTLELLELYSTSKRRGNGRRAMQLIISLADKHRLRLILSAQPFGQTRHMPIIKLVAFYRSLGFKTLGDRSAALLGIEMARQPIFLKQPRPFVVEDSRQLQFNLTNERPPNGTPAKTTA